MVASVAVASRRIAAERLVPWYCHAMVLSATSIIVGLLWDISWHETIGRDTFWTPAHMAIYLGGVLAGVTSGFLVLRATFVNQGARTDSVRIWGFYGPYGAWTAIWGAFAMITSAPFDNWWHNAYGLDVKILSPPHAVLALGMFGVVYGAVLLILARQNRRETAEGWFRGMYIYLSGIAVTMLAILTIEYSTPNQQHRGLFYLIACGVYPMVLVTFGRPAQSRFPVTSVAAAYMAVMLLMGWTLELFPASPRLAPIYHHVDHMVPLGFPLLLVIPALAIDLLMRRIHNEWLLAACIGVAFFTTFLAAQWFFAEFLLSPAADNAVFMGNRIWDFASRPGEWRSRFWMTHVDGMTLPAAAKAIVLAFVSAGIGLMRGRSMQRIMR